MARVAEAGAAAREPSPPAISLSVALLGRPCTEARLSCQHRRAGAQSRGWEHRGPLAFVKDLAPPYVAPNGSLVVQMPQPHRPVFWRPRRTRPRPKPASEVGGG